MPERTFRVIIQNFTKSLTLHHTFSHLCGGAWTPGGWVPPLTIEPGTSGGMQSESAGFATGTEGYAKYDVHGPGGGKRGMVYVYWYNPFYGVTHFRYQNADIDIFPDCDFNPPSGESTNSNAHLSFTFEVAGYTHTDVGTDLTAAGDLVTFVAGPAEFVPGFFGSLGILKDPVLYLNVNDHDQALPQPTPPQIFGDLGPKSWSPMIDAAPEQWLGNWRSGPVSVNIIATQAEPPLFATVADWTTAPPLSFSEGFTPGAAGLLKAAAPLIRSAVQSHGYDEFLRPAFTRAAQVVLKRATETPISPAAAAATFKQIVGHVASSIPTSVVNAKTAVLGIAIGNLLKDKGGVAYLGHHVALTLFGIFQSRTQTGSQILYQRLHADGRPISSVMLDPIPDIR